MRSAIILLLAGSGSFAIPAAAQRAKFTITPFVGAFIPTQELGSIDLPISGTTTTVTAEQKTGAAFGGRIGFTPGRFGVEGSYYYASSKSRISVGILGREDDASVQGGSLKLTFQATDGSSNTDVIISAGVSGISRSGDIFRLSQAVDQFDVGGVVGLGLHLAISPRVSIRLDGDASYSKWSWRGSVPNSGQVDLLLTAGLGLRLGR
jgi:hypothetical protein